MAFCFKRLLISIAIFIFGINSAYADQLEVCIPIEQLDMDSTQLQQNQVPAEQVAAFLGQQVTPLIAPVMMQLSTGNAQHYTTGKIVVAAVVLVAAAVVAAVLVVGVVVVVVGVVVVGVRVVITIVRDGPLFL